MLANKFYFNDNEGLVERFKEYLKEEPEHRTIDKMPISIKLYSELEYTLQRHSFCRDKRKLVYATLTGYNSTCPYPGTELSYFCWHPTDLELSYSSIIAALMIKNPSDLNDLMKDYSYGKNYFHHSEKVWNSCLDFPFSLEFFISIVETGLRKNFTLKEWTQNKYNFRLICDFISCSSSLTREFVSEYLPYLNLYLLKKNDKI